MLGAAEEKLYEQRSNLQRQLTFQCLEILFMRTFVPFFQSLY